MRSLSGIRTRDFPAYTKPLGVACLEDKPRDCGGHKTQTGTLLTGMAFSRVSGMGGSGAAVLLWSCPLIFPIPCPALREAPPPSTLPMKSEHFAKERTHPAPSACCLTRDKAPLTAKLLHLGCLTENQSLEFPCGAAG